ncbi:MAG: acetolactate decarboxylase [Armatimonadota bacterium]
MKTLRLVALAALAVTLVCVLSGFALFKTERNMLFQVSTFNALATGVYDGTMTFEWLGTHGNFGLGTFNALDGEMVLVDKKFFQITADGLAHPVEKSMKTPFAMVTYYDADLQFTTEKEMDLAALTTRLDAQLPTKNIYYAIRVDGEFATVKTRSVPKQYKPYAKLADVTAKAPAMEMKNVKGTLVGFRSPEYAQGAGIPGYHFHFITADRAKGGHALDFRLKVGSTVGFDNIREIDLILPDTDEFNKASLAKNNEMETQAIEQGTK